MELGSMSAAAMAGMGFSVLVSVGLPVFLMLYWRKRTKAKVQFFFIGGGIFILSAMVLEQMCHMLVFGLAGDILQKNFLLASLYSGLAAAVFEETGRFLAMKIFIRHKKYTVDNKSALMYGIGHGGAESILLVGIANINNLTTSVMLNSGALAAQVEELEGNVKTQALQNIQQLVSTPASLFYLAGIERIFAVILQIALTVLVYLGVKHAKKQMVFLAYLGHFLVDFLVVTISGKLNIIAAECLVAALTAAVAGAAFLLWQKYENDGDR